jgi:iron(III) transport system ATP-binding protein
MIAGFEIPSAGDIYLGSERINDLPPDKRNSAMVFQSYALFPHYNIFDNIAYGLKIKNLSQAEIKSRVKQILELVGLEGLEGRNPNQLSGGQQQRVALARALVMEPAVLLFDEPLSNLDAKLRVYMRKEIRKIQQRLGLTSIYVTHDQAEAMSLSDKVIVMNKGKIEQIGTPAQIYQQPATEFVADFIGAANFADGVIKDISNDYAHVDMLGGIIKVSLKGTTKFSAGEAVKVVIRPEAIRIGREGKYDGRVTMSTFMGPVQEYSVTVGDVDFYAEEANPAGKEIFPEDAAIKVSLQEESLHIIKTSA